MNAVVVGPAQRASRRSDADVPPLVGRQTEIGKLRAALATARTGHGQIAEIGGPPGIGKSRLVDELLTKADELTLLVTCDRYAAGTPYALIDAMLRELLSVPGTAGPQTALAAVADAIDRHAAALRTMAAAAGGRRGRRPAADPGSGRARRRIPAPAP